MISKDSKEIAEILIGRTICENCKKPISGRVTCLFPLNPKQIKMWKDASNIVKEKSCKCIKENE